MRCAALSWSALRCCLLQLLLAFPSVAKNRKRQRKMGEKQKIKKAKNSKRQSAIETSFSGSAHGQHPLLLPLSCDNNNCNCWRRMRLACLGCSVPLSSRLETAQRRRRLSCGQDIWGMLIAQKTQQERHRERQRGREPGAESVAKYSENISRDCDEYNGHRWQSGVGPSWCLSAHLWYHNYDPPRRLGEAEQRQSSDWAEIFARSARIISRRHSCSFLPS